jgi:hypothetical protein
MIEDKPIKSLFSTQKNPNNVGVFDEFDESWIA